MQNTRDFEADEIRHQLGNSLAALNGYYILYNKHPENVRRYMFTMFIESKRLVKKLEKIVYDENLIQD